MTVAVVVALCLNGAGLAGLGWVLRNGLARIEAGVTAARKEVADARAAQEHDREVCDRRMNAMEEMVATAANEMRIATDQVTAFLGRCVPGRWRPMHCSPLCTDPEPVAPQPHGGDGG